MSERESRKSNDDHDDDPDDSDDDDDLVLRSEDRDTDMARNAPVSSFCLSLVSIQQTGCTTHFIKPDLLLSEDIFFYSSSFDIKNWSVMRVE